MIYINIIINLNHFLLFCLTRIAPLKSERTNAQGGDLLHRQPGKYR